MLLIGVVTFLRPGVSLPPSLPPSHYPHAKLLKKRKFFLCYTLILVSVNLELEMIPAYLFDFYV